LFFLETIGGLAKGEYGFEGASEFSLPGEADLTMRLVLFSRCFLRWIGCISKSKFWGCYYLSLRGGRVGPTKNLPFSY